MLKKYKLQAVVFFFFVWSCISGGGLFTVSCGSSPQLFFSLFFSSFFFFSGLEKEAQEFWFPFCVRWNSLGKEAPLHLGLSVAADVISFHHSVCVHVCFLSLSYSGGVDDHGGAQIDTHAPQQ